nr:hypothetical protein [Tanacetum cinerariifolium]
MQKSLLGFKDKNIKLTLQLRSMALNFPMRQQRCCIKLKLKPVGIWFLLTGDPAGSLVSTGGVLAGSVPAGSIPTSSVPASSVPASSVPAGSVPAGGVLIGSVDSAGFGDLAASESVHAVFNPFPSDLGNHQPKAGIFSSSSYDDDFCADVT